jgi:hypothetical protein
MDEAAWSLKFPRTTGGSEGNGRNDGSRFSSDRIKYVSASASMGLYSAKSFTIRWTALDDTFRADIVFGRRSGGCCPADDTPR